MNLRSRQLPLLVLELAIAWLAIAAPIADAQTLDDPNLQVQLVAQCLSVPTTMAFVGPNDILVLQKNDGRVRRITNGVLQVGQVLDVAVHFSSERGLLGIALHPAFPATPSVYLYYTESSTAIPPTLRRHWGIVSTAIYGTAARWSIPA